MSTPMASTVPSPISSARSSEARRILAASCSALAMISSPRRLIRATFSMYCSTAFCAASNTSLRERAASAMEPAFWMLISRSRSRSFISDNRASRRSFSSICSISSSISAARLSLRSCFSVMFLPRRWVRRHCRTKLRTVGRWVKMRIRIPFHPIAFQIISNRIDKCNSILHKLT